MKDKKEDVDKLYDWLFHYNPHTSQWAAIPRDLIRSYWSCSLPIEGIYTNKEFEVLRTKIIKLK